LKTKPSLSDSQSEEAAAAAGGGGGAAAAGGNKIEDDVSPEVSGVMR